MPPSANGGASMTFDEFDQREDSGWRAIARQGDFAGAARAIEAYLEAHPALEDRQTGILHFHAAQMHAFAGAVDEALRHLPLSLDRDEPADPLVRWNDYVAATEAFLRGDRAALLAARERIARGKARNGQVPNLHVVDRLIAGFGKPYSEAY